MGGNAEHKVALWLLALTDNLFWWLLKGGFKGGFVLAPLVSSLLFLEAVFLFGSLLKSRSGYLP